MKRIQTGQILITVLLFIAIFISIATFLVSKSLTFMSYATTLINRQQAMELAYGGINIAIAQLSQMPEKTKQTPNAPAATPPAQGAASADKKPPADPDTFLITWLLPVLNRWQLFALNRKADGIDGTVRVCIGSQSGKININELYDFKKHVWIGQDAKGVNPRLPVLQALFTAIESQTGGQGLLKSLEQFLAKRAMPLNDPTELLTIPGWQVFKYAQFYEPPVGPASKQKQQAATTNQKQPLYLTDIFTIDSSGPLIDPLLLSDSLAGVLGLRRVQARESDARAKGIAQVLKNYKKAWQIPADWKALFAPLYEKDFNALPKSIELLLSPSSILRTFWVRTRGTIQNVSVDMYAVLERRMVPDTKGMRIEVAIRKVYVL